MQANGHPIDVHIVVMAKQPCPGRVKTRLTPGVSQAAAAAIASASLSDTLRAVAATPLVRKTVALAGAPGPWLPEGFTVIPQRGNGLDERLAFALEDTQQSCPMPVLLIGMDTPQVTPPLLGASCRTLVTPGTDAVIGLATDGGWWALGLRRVDGELVRGIPTSTSRTGAQQLDRLAAAGLSVALLPTLTDVDDVTTAYEVARLVPQSGFAAAWGAATASL